MSSTPVKIRRAVEDLRGCLPYEEGEQADKRNLLEEPEERVRRRHGFKYAAKLRYNVIDASDSVCLLVC